MLAVLPEMHLADGQAANVSCLGNRIFKWKQEPGSKGVAVMQLSGELE